MFSKEIIPTVENYLLDAFKKFNVNRFDGDDVRSELYIKLIEKLTPEKIADIKSMEGYIRRMVYNEVKMFQRKGNTYKKHKNRIQDTYLKHQDKYGAGFGEDEYNDTWSQSDRDFFDDQFLNNYDDEIQ